MRCVQVEDVKKIVKAIDRLESYAKTLDKASESRSVMFDVVEDISEILISNNICPYCGDVLEHIAVEHGQTIQKCTVCKESME